MNFIKDTRLSKTDLPFIIFLLIFTSTITSIAILFNDKIGIYCSDVFIYLLNSLNFAGLNINSDSTMYLSPVICFITSLLFRVGYINEISIFIVTGIFAVIGNLGFYIFLKYRFNSFLSLVGSVFLFSTSLNLVWLANGTLDVASVGLTTWSLLFFILAVDKNSKYYLIAFPFIVVNFFTRYTSGLIIPVLVVYLLNKYDFISLLDNILVYRFSDLKEKIKSNEFKYFFIGSVLGLIIIVIFLYIIHSFNSDFYFISQSSSINTGLKTSVVDKAYTKDTFYYIKNFLNFIFSDKVIISLKNNPILENISILSYITVLISIVGIIIEVCESRNKVKEYKINTNLNIFTKVFLILSFIFALISFNHISSAFSVVIITLDTVLIYHYLRTYDFKYLNLNLTMFTWFVVNLIVFTYINVKVNRYILTLMPAFVYFFVLGLYYIEEKLDYNIKGKINIKHIISFVLVCFFVFTSFSYFGSCEVDDNINSPNLISKYLINYDSNYSNYEIGVYNKRPYTWFLKKNVWGINDDNREYLNSHDTIKYYISNKEINNLTYYHLIKKENNIYLYERN